MKHALQCTYAIALFFNSMQCKICKSDTHVANHATQSRLIYTTMRLLWHSLGKLTSGAGTLYSFGAHEFTPGFQLLNLLFYAVLCRFSFSIYDF